MSESRQAIENIVRVTKRRHERRRSDDPAMRARRCHRGIDIQWIGLAHRDTKIRDSFCRYHQRLASLQSDAHYARLVVNFAQT
jgi:hypothetical protein